jgi:hypothetical protein
MPTILWIWVTIVLTPLAVLLMWMAGVLLWWLIARCGVWLWQAMQRDRTRLHGGQEDQ